jgi:hypothetical protein
MEEKETAPDVTSGTPEMDLAVLEQVIDDWIWVTVVDTSAGRAVVPIMKQAFAREVRGAVDVSLWPGRGYWMGGITC